MSKTVTLPQIATTLSVLQNVAETVEFEEVKDERPLFIEANTQAITLQELKSDCIVPVFSKDNELTISHPNFIETVCDAVKTFYCGEIIDEPQIRVSHVVKGRIPEAIHKPANQLLESDKTIYYERCAFVIQIPSIWENVNGQKLTLTVGGVRAYNHTNLYAKKGAERFKIFVGFTCKVCTNLCVSTDGYINCLEVTDTGDLYKSTLELLNQYNPAKHIHLMQTLGESYLSEHQFCQILGKMRLYQALSQTKQRALPRMLLTDTQINNVAKAYISDENFGGSEGLSMWNFYNLLTGANKSSYIDSFLDRSYNATEIAVGINSALHGDERYSWFIN